MFDVATQVRLWYWQRISAMVLAVCVLVHLAVMIYAVQGGLSGAEILGRTRGSWSFGLFYSVFVVACAVHVPIGLARVLQEATRLKAPQVAALALLSGAILLVTGMRAVYGVISA